MYLTVIKMHNHVTISDLYAAVYWSAKNISKLSNWILPWEIEDSIDPNNLNPYSLELFFVSLQSLSYHCSIVLLFMHYTPGIDILITSNFHGESNIFLMFKMKIWAKIISD